MTGKNTWGDELILYNAVVTIFEKYALWDKTLWRLVLKHAPLADYLACSFPILTNPLCIQDNNQLKETIQGLLSGRQYSDGETRHQQ